jgi:hypothetical protein
MTYLRFSRSVRCNAKHDSWVKCATSTKCKTDISVVLTIKSGLDFFMISGAQLDSWFDGGLLDQMDFRWVGSG